MKISEGTFAVGGLFLFAIWLFVGLPLLSSSNEIRIPTKNLGVSTVSNGAVPQLASFDKIQILFHEYDTLRTEVLQRHAASFQAIGVIALVLTGLITIIATGREPVRGTAARNRLISRDRALYLLMIASSAIFFGVILWIAYDTTRAACRLRQLEKDINGRAGENLLKWELQWGSGGGIIIKNFYRCPN